MSDASQRKWRFHLEDMIKFTGKVLAYTDGLDQASFVGQRVDDLRRHPAQPGADRRSSHPHPGRDSLRPSRNPLADDYCHPQPAHPWLPGHRRRHTLEHYPG